MVTWFGRSVNIFNVTEAGIIAYQYNKVIVYYSPFNNPFIKREEEFHIKHPNSRPTVSIAYILYIAVKLIYLSIPFFWGKQPRINCSLYEGYETEEGVESRNIKKFWLY